MAKRTALIGWVQSRPLALAVLLATAAVATGSPPAAHAQDGPVTTPPGCYWIDDPKERGVQELWCRQPDGRRGPTGRKIRHNPDFTGCADDEVYDGGACVARSEPRPAPLPMAAEAPTRRDAAPSRDIPLAPQPAAPPPTAAAPRARSAGLPILGRDEVGTPRGCNWVSVPTEKDVIQLWCTDPPPNRQPLVGRLTDRKARKDPDAPKCGWQIHDGVQCVNLDAPGVKEAAFPPEPAPGLRKLEASMLSRDAFSTLNKEWASRFRLFHDAEFEALEYALQRNYSENLAEASGQDAATLVRMFGMDKIGTARQIRLRYSEMIAQYILAKSDRLGLCGQPGTEFALTTTIVTKYFNGYGNLTGEYSRPGGVKYFSVPTPFAEMLKVADTGEVLPAAWPGLRALVDSEGCNSPRLKQVEANMLAFYYRRPSIPPRARMITASAQTSASPRSTSTPPPPVERKPSTVRRAGQ